MPKPVEFGPKNQSPLIRFTIITLFEEAVRPYLESSMLYKAQKNGIIAVDYVNLRDFGLGPHKSVDDTPYGGGDGMLLRVEPVFAAVEKVKSESLEALVILPTPVGKVWDENLARNLADRKLESNDIAETVRELSLRKPVEDMNEANISGADKGLSEDSSEKNETESPAATELKTRHYIIICPHYEGYDERIMTLVDLPISLGNYVLTGGELAALVIIDSVTRLLPGVLGGDSSAAAESFADAKCENLEYPQYTKPAEFRGMKVPEVLLSGNHGEIKKWRALESAERTSKRKSLAERENHLNQENRTESKNRAIYNTDKRREQA